MASDRARESRGGSAVATSIAFVAIAGSVVTGRIVTRVGLVRNAGYDDILIVASLFCSIALTVLIWAQHEHGLGRHFDTLRPGEYVQMLKPFWASIPIYNLGLTFTKLSLILQYLRVFVGKRTRITCFVMLAIIIIYGLWTFVSSILTCYPVAYFWDKTIKDGRCLDFLALWFSNAGVNIATDLALYIMPLPVLNSLQLPQRQKYGLMIVFAVGLFAVITSILRLHSLYIVSIATDITWDNVGAATWSSVELNVGIICACLPTLRPLLIRIFPRLIDSTRGIISGTARSGTVMSKQSKSRRNRWGTFGTTSVSSVLKSHVNVEAGAWPFKELGTPRGNGIEMELVRGGAIGRGALAGLEEESDEEQQGGIKVTKTLEQEVESRVGGIAPSETSSDKDLVWSGSEMRV